MRQGHGRGEARAILKRAAVLSGGCLMPRVLLRGPMSARASPHRRRGRAGRRTRRRSAYRDLDSLRREHEEKGDAIRARLEEFKTKWRQPDERLFEEVAYCILAIQTKARASDAAGRGLSGQGLLLGGGRAADSAVPPPPLRVPQPHAPAP